MEEKPARQDCTAACVCTGVHNFNGFFWLQPVLPAFPSRILP
jgi:hypothetical protein